MLFLLSQHNMIYSSILFCVLNVHVAPIDINDKLINFNHLKKTWILIATFYIY